MMTTLNLIPDYYKEQFRLQRVYSLMRNMMLIITIFIIAITITLLVARIMIQREFVRIIDETTLVTTEHRATEKLIRELNDEVLNVSKIQENLLAWPEFLVDFSSSVPNDITLQNVQFNLNEPSIIIGTAKTRDALLIFRDGLTNNPNLDDVNLPVTNLLNKKNINFRITFMLRLKSAPK